MRAFHIAILPLMILVEGCCTHSQCQRDLYQSHVSAAGSDLLTLKLIDEGKYQRAHTLAMSDLSRQLSEFQVVGSKPSKDEAWSRIWIGKHALKYASDHQAELAQDEWSLEMLSELKRVLVDPSDIRRASELYDHLASSTTNQIPPYKP